MLPAVLCAGALYGEQLAVRVFTTEDGLARNWITQIRRDSKGYLWFCTREGLSLFDGRRFTNYTAADGPGQAYVTDLLETTSGEYWVATLGGLYRFRFQRTLLSVGTRPRFEIVRLGEKEDANSVQVLYEDHLGNIWCATGAGLFRLRPGDSKPEHVDLTPEGQQSIAGIVEDGRGRLWIAGGARVFRRLPSGEVQTFPSLKPIPEEVRSVLLDGDRLWLGGIGGLFAVRIDSEPPRVEVQYQSTARKWISPVDEIYRASDGTFWLGSFGLIRFRPDAKSEAERFQRYLSSDLLGKQSIGPIVEDPAGNLWVSILALGAARIPKERLFFYTEADGLENRAIQGLFETRRGEMVAVSGGTHHFNRFDGAGFQQIQPRLPKNVTYLGWGHGPIALQDRAGDWWTATGHGVLRYTGVDDIRGLAKRTPILYSTLAGLHYAVLRLLEDSRGDIWAGTSDGIARWSRTTGRWKAFPRAQITQRAVLAASVHAMAEDRTGAVWAGIYHSGLVRFRGDSFETVRVNLPAGSVNFLYTDHLGRLWIATTQGGVAVIDHPEEATPAVRVYSREQGLSSNGTHCITEDHWGRIYIANSLGVDRLDPASGRIQRFTAAHGLPPGEIERLYCDRQGSIWFASNFGLARLVPEAEHFTDPPVPLLRSVRVNGMPFLEADLGQPAFSAFELKPDQGNVQIDFSALHFRVGEKLRYQYRLQGADQDWNPPVESQSAHYARLTPGRYRFEVRGVNDANLSSGTAAVEFRLLAPVWQRAWFQALGGLVLGLLAFALHRMRTAQLLHLERVRTRIATDLHDDIGASLSQMAILSEVIGRRASAGDTGLVQHHATKIAAIARDLVDSMSDIVWAINPAKETLEDLEQRMREFAGEMLVPRNIALDFRTSRAAGDLPLSIEARREILLIFKEAIHNLVRHSACTEARVRLEAQNGCLKLEVHDNGRGLESQPAEGNGLCNMRRRAEAARATLEFRSGAGEGTTVSLSVPLRT
jgi:signal transduction histidine kinase/ligand-binding sensor domain-containing protein